MGRDEVSADLEQIRSIVLRHAFPPIVTGFDVRFGDYDGDPAVWIAFKTVGQAARNPASVRERGKILHDFRLAVQHDLLEQAADWNSFFRFEHADTPGER